MLKLQANDVMEVFEELGAALQDGRITPDEWGDILDEADDLLDVGEIIRAVDNFFDRSPEELEEAIEEKLDQARQARDEGKFAKAKRKERRVKILREKLEERMEEDEVIFAQLDDEEVDEDDDDAFDVGPGDEE